MKQGKNDDSNDLEMQALINDRDGKVRQKFKYEFS
jgi:hypothetical protein